MNMHDDHISMRQLLDHAREAKGLARGREHSDLGTDRMFEVALTRLVEMVGEAATRVSTETRELHPEIPWADIAGMRNRLIHGYDAVDLDVLWYTVETDLPPLIAQLESALS